MSNKLTISSRALHDVEKIRDWYDEQSYQAGDRFLDELNSFLTKLIKYPHQYRKINKDVRRCLMETFPYIIYFVESKGRITILRVRHSNKSHSNVIDNLPSYCSIEKLNARVSDPSTQDKLYKRCYKYYSLST